MSEYGDIRAALEAQLATVAGIPDSAHRAGENTEFRGTIAETWIRSRLGYGIERRLTLPARSARVQKDGTWRLLVQFPLNTGTAAADTLVQAIVDAFPDGQTLVSGSTTVRLDGTRRFGGGRDIDESSYVVPIDIRWHVFTTSTLA